MEVGTRIRVKSGVGSSIGLKLQEGISLYGEGTIVDKPADGKTWINPNEVAVLLDGHHGNLIFTEDELEVIE